MYVCMDHCVAAFSFVVLLFATCKLKQGVWLLWQTLCIYTLSWAGQPSRWALAHILAIFHFLGTCGPIVIIITQHRSTTYVILRTDAAYCYRPSSVVCRTYRSVCLSVCHSNEPCKNGSTDRDAVWVEDSGGPKEPCIRWVQILPWALAILRGKGQPIVKYRDILL